MSKYVIDTTLDNVKKVIAMGVTKGGAIWTDTTDIENLEELNSDYINEHFGELQDTAYQKGFEDGKKEAESSEAIEQAKADAFNKGMLFKEEKIHDAYQRGLEEGKKATFGLVADASNAEYQKGLNDAWECARKIVEMADPPYWGVFNEYKNDLFRKISAAEAIAKLKAYEEKQKSDDEIKVGDVVMIKQFKHPENHLFVVTKVSDESVWGVEGDGSWNYWAINEVIKTDKHFDIASILEDMRHD